MSQTLETVPNVDLKKYTGKWFEIASFPQYFQKGCNCTTAEYTLSDKGFVIVENRCNSSHAESFRFCSALNPVRPNCMN